MADLMDLRPRLVEDASKLFHALIFLCPKCRGHEISINIWRGTPSNTQIGEHPDGTPRIFRLWNVVGECVNNFTITPSIARENCGDKCGGWHGFITDGEIR